MYIAQNQNLIKHDNVYKRSNTNEIELLNKVAKQIKSARADVMFCIHPSVIELKYSIRAPSSAFVQTEETFSELWLGN